MKMDVVSFVIFLNVLYFAITIDPNMCRPGICCSGYFLQENKCTECIPGRYGANCSNECHEGFFGRKCKERCPTMCKYSCNKTTGICLEIEEFFEEKLLVVIGTSSSLVLICCTCMGAFLLCKGKQKKNGAFDNATSAKQNKISSNNERNESEMKMHNYLSSPIPPPPAQDNGETKLSTNKTETDSSEVVYSKPEKKRFHITVQESDMSLELLSPDVSDGEDVLDSDEFDDEADVINIVEHSVNTFISTTDKKQTRTDYEHMF